MALQGHGSRAAGTQGHRGDISEEFQLIRPVTLTLSETTMTSIYKMGGRAGHKGRQGPAGRDHGALAEGLPGRLPAGPPKTGHSGCHCCLAWAPGPHSSQGLSRWGGGVVPLK